MSTQTINASDLDAEIAASIPSHRQRPLSYRPNEACRLLSIGRTKLYQLIANGDLETFNIGRARLIRAESLHRLAGSRAA